MGWAPPDGKALVNCSVFARDRVRFDLWLGEKQLCYSREKFAFGDSLETVTVERSSISNVVLVKKSPWIRRGLGVFLAMGATVALVSAFQHEPDAPFGALVGYAMAFACVFGTGNQWELSFSDGKTEHVISQPMAGGRSTMNVMAQAIQDVAGQLQGATSVISVK